LGFRQFTLLVADLTAANEGFTGDGTSSGDADGGGGVGEVVGNCLGGGHGGPHRQEALLLPCPVCGACGTR